jgi:hypothetical protein
MLGNVNKKTVYDAFNNLGIGQVIELDMVYKINENRNSYYFAFIKITPYNTPQSRALQSVLDVHKPTPLVYDEEAGQYWEIKKYIPRDKRNKENIKQKQPTLLPTTMKTATLPDSSNNNYYSNLVGGFASIWQPIAPMIAPMIESLIGENVKPNHSIFTEQDKLDLVEEYEELERQIRIEVFESQVTVRA